MEELKVGTVLKLEGNPVPNKVFVHPLPFNLIPHIDNFQVTIWFADIGLIFQIDKCIYKGRNESGLGNAKDIW